MPDQIELLRNHLIGKNAIIPLQYYVMLLISIKLFLRASECQMLNVDDIDTNLSQKNANGMVALVIIVRDSKGKAQEYRFNLYEDSNYPAFCPIRHLLIYIHMAGIKSGSLFPTASELKNPPEDGHFKTKISYDTFHTAMKGFIAQVLDKNQHVGTHTYRKTG
jgi:integrase